MSAPSYIINWEELLEVLGDRFDVEINDIELGDLEDYLYEQFGVIIDLLKQILELLRDKGVQRIHTIANHIPAVVAPYKFTTTFNEDVLITGVTYSQSAWKYQDSWDLVVDGTILFEEVGTKEIGESKQMNVFYFVPAGKEVDIVFHNDSGNSRLVWFDIEYIGLSMNSYLPTPDPMGMVVVNYITEDNSLVATSTITDLKYGTHIIKPDTPNGYALVGPDRQTVTIDEFNHTVVIEFVVEMEEEEIPPIDHDYDILAVLRWEDNSDADIDFHAFVDCDPNKHIYYSNKEFTIDQNNKIWLDYDYTSHGPDGRESQPEIISILGAENNTINLYVTNYSGKSISEDVTVEFYKWIDGKNEKIKTITLNTNTLSRQKTVYLANVKNGQIVEKKQNIDYDGSMSNLGTCQL